jgi:cysteine desulfurase / selenocysteine lyase
MPITYLNNAATSWPKAPGVAEAIGAKIQDIPFHAGRSGFNAPDLIGDCRYLLAESLHIADPARIVFCANATQALNIALHGFPWKKEATVLTTAAEHNSVLRPLYYLHKHRQLRIETVPVDTTGRVIPEVWEAAVKKFSPQLVVFTHASNVTGGINPVVELCKIAKTVGACTLLDASQTMGLVEVTPEAWGVEMVAFTGHKYLLGPPGTGGLYISAGIELEPVWVGGTGVLSELDEMPPHLPVRFEAGTPNDPAFAGLAQSVIWQKANPVDLQGLNRKIERLSLGLLELGAKVIGVSSPRMPVVAFVLPGWETEEVGEILYKSFDLICRTGLHCAPQIHKFLETGSRGSIRFSLSRFTTDEEIEYALSALRGIMV